MRVNLTSRSAMTASSRFLRFSTACAFLVVALVLAYAFAFNWGIVSGLCAALLCLPLFLWRTDLVPIFRTCDYAAIGSDDSNCSGLV